MRISVIIPTYNRRAVLLRAIQSVVRQSRPAEEIIVVDDGSTDGTADALTKAYAKQVKILRTDSNRGVSAARNLGLAQCSGDWVALLDSDDEWLPTKLEQQITQLQNHDCDICHTEETWIRNGVRVNQMNKHKKHGGDIFEHCLAMCAMSPSSVLIKKNLILQAGGFDESLPACEDYDLWLKLCAEHPVLFLEKPLIRKYGGHADQLSRQHWGMDRFRVRALDALLDNNRLPETKRQLTINMLLKKTRILHKGAIKHHNQPLAEYCETLQQKYT